MATTAVMMLISFRLDVVQRQLASFTTKEIENILEIPVNIEAIKINSLDEVVLRNVSLLDQQGDTAIASNKITAHISPLELLKYRIQVNTLAIEAPIIKIHKENTSTPLNIQFILDKLKSNEESKTSFGLRINQLLIYDGSFRYDIKDVPINNGMFDASHIAIDKIRCNISLKEFLKEELDLRIRVIEGIEKSGLELKKLKANVEARKGTIKIRGLEAKFPNSNIASDSVNVIYLKESPNALKIDGNIESDHFAVQDFAPLSRKIPDNIPAIAFKINGHADSILSRVTLTANTKDDNISLKTIATINNPYSKERITNIYLRHLNLDKPGIELIESFADIKKFDLTDKIGNLLMSGETEIRQDSVKGYVNIETINGHISADINLNNEGNFKLSTIADGINISEIADLDETLTCSIQAEADGNIGNGKREIEFIGKITDLQTQLHSFTPIDFKGAYKNDTAFHAETGCKDPGLSARIGLNYNKRNDDRITLSVDVDSITPEILGIKKFNNNKISFKLKGEYTKDAETSLFNAKLQNLTVFNETEMRVLRNLHFCDNQTEEQRLLMLNSDFIKCSVIGDFDYSTLAKSLYKLTARHIPSLAKVDTTQKFKSNYIFKCDLQDSKFISNVLDLPLVINEDSYIHGICNDEKGILSIDSRLNNIEFKKSRYKSIELNGVSNNQKLTLGAKVVIPAKKKSNVPDGNDMSIEVQCNMQEDIINNNVHWSNNREKRRTEGFLHLETTLKRDSRNMLSIDANIAPDSIVHNDSIWYISGGKIFGNTEKIDINNLRLYNDSQFLHVDGSVGREEDDKLLVKASNLEVSTIFDLVRFKILQFNGNATGKAEISSLLSAPEINGRFKVDSFKIDNGYLGRTDLNIGWDNSYKSITLDAEIRNDSGKVSTVNGFLSQANDTIHLDIEADELNAVFINKLTQSFITDIDGTANGKVSILGKWRKIDLKGAVSLNCGARLVHTNVKYRFHGDSLFFTNGRFFFNEAMVTDRRGNKGWLSGEVTHQNLGNWSCNLNARVENLLAYDTNNFDALPLYGTVYATGNVNLRTNEKGIFLKAEVSNNPNSRIVYNSSDIGGVSDNSFITFKDSSKKQEEDTQHEESNSAIRSNIDSRLNLDFMVDVNESMQVKVYTNYKSDDYIELYGKGAINAIYDEKEGFSMKGNMDLERGAYKITVQDIFTKEFCINKGSTLLFNGNPYDAQLNINAKYLVPSASLNALTTETTNRKTVKVNCLLNITGTLESPELSFDLELPEGSEEEKEMLASATSTPEQKNMQFIYLLGIGKFYTYDYNNPIATNTQSNTAMESLISNTLSGQLNNMLGQIINNNNWSISGNFSTSERGWNSMEVEGMLEGRLLNDRLLINGNFGYRENPVANRNFIGDFELQWLLNKKGTISLRAYSKTNDRYFSKTNLTTQGAGIILRHDFNYWRWWKKKEKKEEKDKKEDE